MIVARYIRIHPKSWHGNIALRTDFNGCLKGIIGKVLMYLCKGGVSAQVYAYDANAFYLFLMKLHKQSICKPHGCVNIRYFVFGRDKFQDLF